MEDQQTGVDEASVFASLATQHCKASCLDDAIGLYSAAAAPDGTRDAVHDCIDGLAACSSSADTNVFCTKITAQLVNIACLQGRPSALVADVAVTLLLSPLPDPLAVNALTWSILDFRLSFEYNPIRTGEWIALVPFLCFADSASLEAVKAVFKLWNDRIDSLPLPTILSWHTPSSADLSQLGSKQQQVEMLDGLLSTMPRSKLIK
ncbi:hypothetical protein DFJ73DRAFT_788458 [Zopfochytrium polystomum]|nr:hypothetical protein DFJ73DRAFT_788458 [Zopfochytrium polystomum]